VDRLTGVADPHRIACLEFAPNAGWWGVYSTDDTAWDARVKSAFRLLADSGFGGERSRGWGRAAAPEFHDAGSLLAWSANDEGALWLLSLYSPHASDTVDWSRGEYGAVVRGGWTDSQSGVAPKRLARMVREGSVVYAPALRGRAVDVAPEGFPHPVYRAGFALAIPAPPEPILRAPQQAEVKVQEPPAIAMENEGGPALEPELEPLPEVIRTESQPEPAARMENEGAPPEESRQTEEPPQAEEPEQPQQPEEPQ
ncbi:MAG TPA: hypothetical protein VFT60_07840, partial [Bryobacteraceae bacterium]|nr:hypothetical protein [Bryobacteraceae bacterium]